MLEWAAVTALRAVAVGTPLLWAALGEVFAERSGIVNLGVEGMMILGAFSAFAVAHTTGAPVIGLCAAAAVGGIAAALHAFMAVTLRANQYVSGLALTMFGLGLAGVLGRGWEGIPLLESLPEISFLTYGGLLLAVALWALLFYTQAGIVIRSTGESPAAAEALGINVYLVRYLCVIFGGTLAGVAGGFLSVAYRPSWTEGMTAGMGWIAIAIAIFSGWDPLKAVAGAVLFGGLFHLSFRLQAHIAPEVLRMMPFAFTILVLVLTARGRRGQGAPEALGLPYARGEK